LTLAEQAKNRFKIAVDAELAQVGCPPVTIAVVAVAVDCCSDVILTFVVAGTSQVLLIQGGAGQNQRQPVPAGEEQDASYRGDSPLLLLPLPLPMLPMSSCAASGL
jgi:hypothetical protein